MRPEMWPSTSCPLSSFARNIVFGRASWTSPSTSIFSSLTHPSGGTAKTISRPGIRPALERDHQVAQREALRGHAVLDEHRHRGGDAALDDARRLELSKALREQLRGDARHRLAQLVEAHLVVVDQDGHDADRPALAEQVCGRVVAAADRSDLMGSTLRPHSAWSVGWAAGSRATASASSTVCTGWNRIASRTVSGTSSRSPAFRAGRITSVRPARCAASTFCFSPPIGSTRPRSGPSPFMPTAWRTARPVSSETSAIVIVMPALGPSFGTAPAGTWTWKSRCANTSGSIWKSTAWLRT